MSKEELIKALEFVNEERERLQDIIDKAIEYINHAKNLKPYVDGNYLLNILRGEDNE